VPPKRGVEHAIQMMPGTTPPPARGLRHQSERDAAVLHEYVKNGEMAGILQKSTSPYGSMALVVMKKDGTPRVVIDYRALNEVTVKNKYPLPLMDELFDRVARAKFFSTMDLRNGFHQIAIRVEDREKTAFRTRLGHYEYTVLATTLASHPLCWDRCATAARESVAGTYAVVCTIQDCAASNRSSLHPVCLLQPAPLWSVQ
jgi:hypothetical protein